MPTDENLNNTGAPIEENQPEGTDPALDTQAGDVTPEVGAEASTETTEETTPEDTEVETPVEGDETPAEDTPSDETPSEEDTPEEPENGSDETPEAPVEETPAEEVKEEVSEDVSTSVIGKYEGRKVISHKDIVINGRAYVKLKLEDELGAEEKMVTPKQFSDNFVN